MLATDLLSLAEAAGLPFVDNADDLAAEAERIGAAFEWYSVWARTYGRDAPEAAKRDWCKAVARQAQELLTTLGHPALEGMTDGARSIDAMHILGQHWPAGEADRADAHRLESWAWRADGQRMQAASRAGKTSKVRDTWGHLLRGRMPLFLRMLEVLASRGVNGYGAHVKRGGKSADYARHGLFFNLVGSYERLFGELPGISRMSNPDEEAKRDTVAAGSAMEWHSGLLHKVQARARELGRWPGANDEVPDADLDPEYRVIVELAGRATSGGPNSDALAHWITDGAKAWASKPEVEAEADDPAFEAFELEEIFGPAPE